MEAAALLENPIFQRALNDMYSNAAGILMSAEVGSLTASTAHATMKAIAGIKSQLEQYGADFKIQQKYHKEKK